MKRFGLLLLVGMLVSVSCKKDKVSPFAGEWSGGYTGSDQGMWSVTVDDDGTISGMGTSLRSGANFSLEGSVSNNGNFLATIGSVATGSEFTGTLTTEGQASGTWKNTLATPPQEGTWIGSRDSYD